jgi:hypothetical protein
LIQITINFTKFIRIFLLVPHAGFIKKTAASFVVEQIAQLTYRFVLREVLRPVIVVVLAVDLNLQGPNRSINYQQFFRVDDRDAVRKMRIRKERTGK